MKTPEERYKEAVERNIAGAKSRDPKKVPFSDMDLDRAKSVLGIRKDDDRYNKDVAKLIRRN